MDKKDCIGISPQPLAFSAASDNCNRLLYRSKFQLRLSMVFDTVFNFMYNNKYLKLMLLWRYKRINRLTNKICIISILTWLLIVLFVTIFISFNCVREELKTLCPRNRRRRDKKLYNKPLDRKCYENLPDNALYWPLFLSIAMHIHNNRNWASLRLI